MNANSLPVGYLPSWDIGDRHKVNRLQRRLKHLRKRPLKILDVGCGTGILDIVSAMNGHVLFSTDLSQERLEILKTTLNKIPESLEHHPVRADGFKLPFKDQSFDVAISSHVLEHLNTPKEFLEEMSRVVVDNGYCFLYTPSDYHRIQVLRSLGVVHDPEDHIVEGFSPEGMKKILPSDLEMIEYEYHRKIIEANMVEVIDFIGKMIFGSIESGSQQASSVERKYRWLKNFREIFISVSLFFIFIIDETVFKRQKGVELDSVIKKVFK